MVYCADSEEGNGLCSHPRRVSVRPHLKQEMWSLQIVLESQPLHTVFYLLISNILILSKQVGEAAILAYSKQLPVTVI